MLQRQHCMTGNSKQAAAAAAAVLTHGVLHPFLPSAFAWGPCSSSQRVSDGLEKIFEAAASTQTQLTRCPWG
jgi:hypothetical protein